MHSIELSKRQVQQLVDFGIEHKQNQWFIAKDHGAYVGAAYGAEPGQNCVFYFKGCDPSKDEDWYDTAHAKFGGDDFGEQMPLADLQRYLEIPNLLCIEIKVKADSICIDAFEVPDAEKGVEYYGLRRPNGKIGCVKKVALRTTLLQIEGGGTPAHIARADAAAKELQEKGSITVKGYWIGPLSEV
jgi:hypothetical protein